VAPKAAPDALFEMAALSLNIVVRAKWSPTIWSRHCRYITTPSFHTSCLYMSDLLLDELQPRSPIELYRDSPANVSRESMLQLVISQGRAHYG
jgi:hypothetical protein